MTYQQASDNEKALLHHERNKLKRKDFLFLFVLDKKSDMSYKYIYNEQGQKEAALLRATHTSRRLPDAIHLATAFFSQCTIFLTNDSRIKAIPKMQILLLKDFVQP